MSDYVFTPNATVLKDYFGTTPFILGCDQDQVKVLAGTRVHVLETRHTWTRYHQPGFGWVGFNDPTRPCYKVRFPADKPGCYWTLWLGTESYPAIDVLKLD
jgi:hypothetical protein